VMQLLCAACGVAEIASHDDSDLSSDNPNKSHWPGTFRADRRPK